MKRIVIGAGAAGFNFLPIFIAQHEKYFGAHGLEVEVRRTGSTEKATAALLAGELNIAITPPEGAILNYLNGLPLALIAQPRYKQIADLRGATFGTSSMTEGTAIYSMEILAQNGLQYPTDYRFSLVGVHTARWEALKHGTLDAALQLIPLNFVAEDAGYNNLAQAYECIPEIAFISIIVSQEWANTNRAALVGVLQAIHAGMKVMHDRASDGLSLRLLAEVVKAEPKYVARSLNLVREKKMMPADLSISAKAFETSVRLMRKAGILSTDAGDLAAVMDDQYRKAAGL
jgi:ABC-type nitrate/sulfonate/bicarbonate transport system substrate-binding protein